MKCCKSALTLVTHTVENTCRLVLEYCDNDSTLVCNTVKTTSKLILKLNDKNTTLFVINTVEYTAHFNIQASGFYRSKYLHTSIQVCTRYFYMLETT